jgi:DNA helicase-2/ATP-dependent DNA helicase PcrA
MCYIFNTSDMTSNNINNFIEHLKTLNPEQLEAVKSTEGALLVLAGAGTGKTRVLTTRIAFILASSLAYPSNILAVTFTNKAAKEMEHRIVEMVGDAAAGLWLGTFHSICLRIIRKHVEAAGLKPDFSIINQDDQLRLIKEIHKELKLDEKKFNPKATQAIINRWKDRAQEPYDVTANDSNGGDELLKVYEIYANRCKTLNCVDFGDLILRCITLFKNFPEILAEYQRKFRYILVDEYQDTNVAQYMWLKLLAGAKHNICCVGDDDQSIYGWRGAEIGNILRFEKEFEGAGLIKLETNYRSTQDILSAADSLIANNNGRLGKTLKAHHGKGEKIKLVSVWDDRSEAAYIAEEIESQQAIYKQKLNDFAILVRAGHQTRSLEEAFIQRALPYRILGGLKFYERMEIRDAIAYVRAVLQPQNDLALERIINVPRRGLGDKTLDGWKAGARAKGLPLQVYIRENLGDNNIVKPKMREVLGKLFLDFDMWVLGLKTETFAQTIERILEDTGYIQMWKSEGTPEANGRIENLKELINAIAEFDNIDDFLEHVSLVSDNDETSEENMVSIMTIHGAKGLEFEHVFLPGWEEGLFPSQQSIDEKGKDGLEEERRLAYVAITRAKKHLSILFAASRMVFGNVLHSIPSRFIDEIPDEFLEEVNKGRGASGGSSKNFGFAGGRNAVMGEIENFLKEREQSSFFHGLKNEKAERLNSKLQKIDELKSLDTKNNFILGQQRKAENLATGGGDAMQSKFSVGQKIHHEVFGFGRVLNINGKHLQIVFEKSAIKTLLEDFVKAA